MKNTVAKKKCGLARKALIGMSTLATMLSASAVTAFADDWESVSVQGGDANASEMMGSIIGILLTITRYVGVALVVYGVYEIVMSFMQNQPEAKTKGIIMALAGIVMTSLKSILQALKIVG
jgi:hypothetical protein